MMKIFNKLFKKQKYITSNNIDDSSWFKTHQIETFVGNMRDDMSHEEMQVCRKKLIILHQCGDNKQALISQLKTMISGLETDFENFAG